MNGPVVFDAAFLQPADAATLDLSRFAHGNPVLPGHYDVDVWMNGEWQARRRVRFEALHDGAEAHPCFTHDDLVAYGLDPAAPSGRDDDPCPPVEERIASATTRFDVGEQRLDIEIPQAAMARRRAGVPTPGQWDHGVTAGMLAWRVSARDAVSSRGRYTSLLAGADAGVNAGAWRWRHAVTWAGRRFARRHAYVERPLAGWHARLRVGEFGLVDDMFSPIRLQGISIASDARMAADGVGGYAPRVKGIATGHATVRITQNGLLLRDLVVPPGPFEVDDLYAAGHGGDIEVDIEEQGRHRTFRVPYFPVPELMREGRTAHALSAGRFLAHGRYAGVTQASWRHGFAGAATAYAGWRLSSGFGAVVVGGAMGTSAGAFATDVTRSRAPGGRGGTLWRLRHGRLWPDGTLVSLGTALGREASFPGSRGAATRTHVSRRVDVLVQRELGGRGSLGLNVSYGFHGRERGRSLDHVLSWARGWRAFSLDATFRRSRRQGVAGRSTDTSGQLSLSVPMGRLSSTAMLQAEAVHGPDASGVRMGLYGSAGESAATQYGVVLARDRAHGQRLDLSASRRLDQAEVAATFDRSASTRGASLSASGGLVFHAGGITPATRLGDTLGLVRARGAHGAGVSGGSGTRVGRSGYAVLSHLAPYRWNTVDLDPAGTSLDVGFVSTHRRVAPVAGAIVLLPFETDVAKTLLVTARLPDGRPVPFGAEVRDAESRYVGLVGQGGRVFLRTESAAGPWSLRWSQEADGQCVLRLESRIETADGTPRLEGVCE